jgi:DNA invertase Pin-like site-specific DNA recombinase
MSRRERKATRPPISTPSLGAVPQTATLLRSGKISHEHLQRLAVVYVRQSSPHQVLHHRESRERQYALVDRAVALGWSHDRVLVIDEDQGQSGKTAAGRSGFHRLLTEVALAHVGLVLGLEMSRLARSSKDWHHLLEMCALFGTILADEDGVYDPGDANDRLLLGLKGTISEFELVTMHNRLERGKLNKAQRGALFYNVPAGYVKVSADHVALDPDAQVREVIRLIFDKYDELGSAYGVFRYLVRNHIRIGVRAHTGPCRGQLEWHHPTPFLVRYILAHPIYAGVYTYGRRRNLTGTSKEDPSPADEQAWQVFLRDRLPAYIPWERFLANQERLRHNRCGADTPGPPRQGTALLAGLIRCGTCGRRLQVRYGRKDRASYCCVRHLQQGTEQTCHGLRAADVDELVAQQVLRALEPAALELSVKALQERAQERARLDRHWQQRRERARYESQEAERRYRAVDPENRLVARTLEGRWEEALRCERELAEEYDRFQQEKPQQLSRHERCLIDELSSDIPRLWHAPTTTAADRKAIIRQLVTDVVVHVRKESEWVDVTIHWQGGFTSQHEITRAVRSYEQLQDHDQLFDRIVTLWRAGRTAPQIAAQLNDEGFVPAHRKCRFTGGLVRQLLCRRGYGPDRRADIVLGEHEWWLTELAKELRVRPWKLRQWGRRGWLRYRQTPMSKLWIVWADGEELKRLRRLKARSKHGQNGYSSELTTPKQKKRR